MALDVLKSLLNIQNITRAGKFIINQFKSQYGLPQYPNNRK